MKNKFIIIISLLLFNIIFSSNLNSSEIFNFNVTELEVTQNGNLYKGTNGGKASTQDGILIIAEDFEFNKLNANLIAKNNVQFIDSKKDVLINADEIIYFKNQEKIIARNNVQFKDSKKGILINADEIIYFKNQEKIIADKNVRVKDLKKDILINADKIIYFKGQEKIVADNNVKFKDNQKKIFVVSKKITYLKKVKQMYTEGETEAFINSKYKFVSKDVVFNEKNMKLYSYKKTIITDDNHSQYELGSFNYHIKNEFLKGTNISIIQNTLTEIGKSDRLFFKSGFFDLKSKNFKSAYTEINLKKSFFNNNENDPRLYGASSYRKNNITTIEKAVFTSCKKTDKCPPWRIEASKIVHDKDKKQLIYDNAVLKIRDVPVLYFPKFFHPDPTVKRQSGFLQPKIHSSNTLGSSLSIPYFHIISDNKDFTLNPMLFTKDVKMIQSEFRQQNENSTFIADIAFVNGYKSSSTKDKKNINHLFAKFQKNLKLSNFITSDLNIFLEKVNNDTYLKVFDGNLQKESIKPKNSDILNSGFDIYLENENFLISGGANIYEDLSKEKSDRFQFVLPYYNYSNKSILTNYGSIDLNSKGNSTLDNTNQHTSKIINDISLKMNDKIFENLGLKNNFNIYFKNLNSLGKNVTAYKSSPEIELQSLIEFNSELPLIKNSRSNNQLLVPRLSFKINPNEMKDHSDANRKMNMRNIFNLNRLGLDDSLESGNSLTLGVDYKKDNIKYDDNSLEIKLATVFRDKIENNIPTKTSLNKKNSNLFGAIDYRLSNKLNISYDFIIDNKVENSDYNSIGLDLSLNNFVTTFNFIEEREYLGNANIFENISKINFNNRSSLSFKTRRNREISLTEYYNLVYEYKNDCLTAGIRFDKTYYEDRDLKPSEDFMFTISFFPLTSFSQSIN